MKNLHISVADKIATYYQRDGEIVCGNSNYQIEFVFDTEWASYSKKTARFIVYPGKTNAEPTHYEDVDFTGTICPVPIITGAQKIEVGVYAGNLCTTTPATIGCKPSILCPEASPSVENDKRYANEAKEAAESAEAAADRALAAAENAEIHTISTAAELQQAIADGLSVISLNRNAEIELSGKLTVPESVSIIGNGATIKRVTGYEGVLIELSQKCKIADLIIDGNREAMNSPTWSNTIEIATRANCIVDSITINNANEAILVYGDDVLVSNCRINNCGGNGIHFSGADRTKVVNCVVIGANKRAGMGHEDGGIIWSDECNYTTCINNHVEDAKSGFGAIDYSENSFIKIIGNTVLNCTNAIDAEVASGAASPTYDIVIANNYFKDSGKVNITCADNVNPSMSKLTFSGNILNGTRLTINDVHNAAIEGNIISTESGNIIALSNAKKVTISGNTLSTTSSIGIYASAAEDVVIKGNVIEAVTVGIQLESSTRKIIDGNIINQAVGAASGNFAIRVEGDSTIANNRLSLYGDGGVLLTSDSVCSGNRIFCNNPAAIAIRVWGGNKNYIVTQNMSNGSFAIANSDTAVISNNIACGAGEFASETA